MTESEREKRRERYVRGGGVFSTAKEAVKGHDGKSENDQSYDDASYNSPSRRTLGGRGGGDVTY